MYSVPHLRPPCFHGLSAVAALLVAATALHAADKATHFIIEGAVPADRGNGIVLNLGTATLTSDRLVLHIGFRNMGVSTIPTYGRLDESDFHLGEESSLSEIDASRISPDLRFVSPPDGLPPRLANAGTIVFPRPASLVDLNLRVSGFAPIAFSLISSSEFSPHEAIENISVKLPATILQSHHDHLSIFPIHISNVQISNHTITIDLEFENASNRSFVLNTAGVSGFDAFLVDADFRNHTPTTVSPSLSESIGPVGERWNAGAFNGGSITFDQPHAHAIRRILISFPTYESLILNFDESSRTYKAQVLDIGDPVKNKEELHPLRVSANLYTDLSRVMKQATDALNETRIVDYLNLFTPDSQARETQTPFLTGMSKVDPSDVKFGVLRDQPLALEAGVRVKDVTVFFDYVLPLPGGSHRFRSLVVCTFSKASSTGDWEIDRWRFAKDPPFWLIGLTELESSDHFSIYVRPGIVPKREIQEVQNELEDAYARLQANENIHLKPSYLAFLADRAEDFQFLTSQNALRYNGVATMGYTIEGDRYVSLNHAMFLNVASFRRDTDLKSQELRNQTVVHEFAHLALASDTRHFTPPWLVEGIAIQLADQLSADSSRALIETGSLPTLSLSALSRGPLPGAHISGQAVLNFQYIYAGETVAYLIRTYGEKRFFDYYRSFANIAPSQLDALAMEQSLSAEQGSASIPKLMHQITLELTRQQYGISLYDLDAVVRASILMKSNGR